MVLYPILLSQSWSTTVPNFMLVSGIAQSGQNLALSRLANKSVDVILEETGRAGGGDLRRGEGSTHELVRDGHVFVCLWEHFTCTCI